jgi:hypothetical protein
MAPEYFWAFPFAFANANRNVKNDRPQHRIQRKTENSTTGQASAH